MNTRSLAKITLPALVLAGAFATPVAAVPSTYDVSCAMGANSLSQATCNSHIVSGAIGPSTDPTSVHSRLSDSTGNLIEVEAAAGAGFVGAFSHTRDSGNTQDSGSARAIMDLRDVVFSSSGTDPVSVMLNLHLSGDFSLTSHAGVFGDPNRWEAAGAEIKTRVIVGTSQYFGNYSLGVDLSSGAVLTTKGGMLAALPDGVANVDRIFQLAATVPVNVPVQVLFDLESISGVGGSSGFNNGVSAEALNDFVHTMSFDPNGPAFTLPDGVTVNSVDGNIDNNQWGTGAGNSVPEPSSSTLLLLGLAGFVFYRRRLTRQGSAR